MPQGDIAEIGKYKILGQIGEGAMGVVYRALDPVLNRAVAIKVMSDALARDTDLRGRFLREAQSAGSLQHPNVITIYDFGEVDGHPFIAMEFVEGADLHEILENKSPLSLVQKIDILVDVLNGLSYAHKRGIVHRDIKPANIRIDEDGRARVMDFGIAHLNSSSMTRTGVMVGTPAYMSPEQITGGEISATSDVFAVGAVMYELLTGVQAFRGESLQTVMYKIVSAPTPELKSVSPAIAPERKASVMKALDAIVTRALAKDPSDRFESANDMVAALSDVRARVLDENDPIRTTSLRATVAKVMADTTEHKAARRARQQTIGLLIGGTVALAAIAVALAAYTRGRGASTAPSTVAAVATPPVTPSVPSTGAPANPAPPNSPPTQTASAATVAPAAPSTKPAATTSPSAKELSLFRSLQTTALESRRRAAEAGATADQLDGGDGHNKMAMTLVSQGKTAEAGDHLNQAAALWGAAERTARAASAAAAAAGTRTTVAEQPKPQAPQPVATVTPIQQPQVAQPAPVQPASNPAADIASVVAAYARALESRDVAAVRRAYPGITSAQAKGWEQFFSTLRSLRVNLSVNGLDVNGGNADAKLVGAYDYVTDGGKASQQPVSFQASFRRDGSAWQLMAVH